MAENLPPDEGPDITKPDETAANQDSTATVPSSAGPRSSGPPYSGGSFDLGSPYRRWGLTAVLILLAIYFGTRLASSYEYVKPSTIINETLHVVFDHAEYGVTPDHVLTRVNATRVAMYSEYRQAVSRLTGDRVSLAFTSPTEEDRVDMQWIRFERPVKFEITESLELIPQVPDFPDDVFAPDERVVAINGVAIGEAVRLGLEDEDLRKFRTRFTTSMPSGAAREIVIQHLNWAVYAGRYFVGLGMAALALIAVWLKPNARSARAFYFFAFYLSLWWYLRSIPFHHRLNTENYTYHAVQCFIFVPCLTFLFTFSPLRHLQASRKVLATLGALAGVLFIVGNGFSAPALSRYGLLLPSLQLIWAGALVLVLILAVTSGFWARIAGTAPGSTDRERMRVIWISFVFGVGPALIYTTLRFRNYLLEHTETTYEFDFLIELTALIFPLALLYGVVRHNLLRANELLREGFLYLLLISALIALYGLSAGALEYVAKQGYIAELNTAWIGPILVAGTVVVAIPVHSRVREAIHRRLDRVPVAYASFIQSLRQYSTASPTPQDYCQKILEELRSVTDARTIEICTRFPDDGRWALAAAIPAPRTDVITERCSGLFELLQTENTPVYRDDVLEDVHFTDSREDLLEGMNALDASMVFPLRAYGRLVGALAIGEKSGGRSFTASEIRSLMNISQRVGEDLSNLAGPTHREARRKIAEIFPRYPEKIGRYTVEGVVGEGGMAYVYLGALGGERVAIKVANRFVQANSTLIERFRREASAIQQVRSPHTIEVVEIGWQGHEPYIVMEYFPDGSLTEIIRNSGPLDEPTAARAILHAVCGLETALAAGIVHRDVKPRNLFRTPDGVVKIGDFGLAMVTDRTTLTRAGEVMGTPEYISPEVIEGHSATWQSDQYALGVTFYELLTGKKPFTGAEFQVVLYQHLNKAVPDVRRIRREISTGTSEVIKRMLSKRPEERFPSYAELAGRIEAILAH